MHVEGLKHKTRIVWWQKYHDTYAVHYFFCGYFAVIARVEICILPRLLGTCLFQHYSWTTLTFWNSHWSPLCTTELRRRPRWCFATLLMWTFFMLSLNRPITSMRLHKASNDQDYSVKKHNSKSYHNSKMGLLQCYLCIKAIINWGHVSNNGTEWKHLQRHDIVLRGKSFLRHRGRDYIWKSVPRISDLLFVGKFATKFSHLQQAQVNGDVL